MVLLYLEVEQDKWQNLLPDIHSMQALKRTNNTWEGFLNTELHRHFMDKSKYTPINTK